MPTNDSNFHVTFTTIKPVWVASPWEEIAGELLELAESYAVMVEDGFNDEDVDRNAEILSALQTEAEILIQGEEDEPEGEEPEFVGVTNENGASGYIPTITDQNAEVDDDEDDDPEEGTLALVVEPKGSRWEWNVYEWCKGIYGDKPKFGWYTTYPGGDLMRGKIAGTCRTEEKALSVGMHALYAERATRRLQGIRKQERLERTRWFE